MLKEDLKKGDWVLYTYNNLPYKVSKVEENFAHIEDKDGRFVRACPYCEINPIPLTKKILLENGWEHFEVNARDFSLDRLLVGDRGDYFSVCLMESPHACASIYITDIHYVHELQHILWAHKTGYDINMYKPEPIVKWKVFQLQLTHNGLNKETKNPQYIVTPRCIGITSSHGKPSLDTIFHICNYCRWQDAYRYDFSQPITVEGVTLTPTQFFTGECQSDIYVTTEDKNEVIVCDSAGWKTLNSVSEAQTYMLKTSPYFNVNNITNKEDFDL